MGMLVRPYNDSKCFFEILKLRPVTGKKSGALRGFLVPVGF